PGVYEVMLVAKKDQTCSDTAYAEFEAFSLLQPTFNPPASQCFDGHSFGFEAGGDFHSGAEFFWDFGPMASPTSATATNPQQVTFSEPGTYAVTLNVVQEECEGTFTEYVHVYTNPLADFSANVTEGCTPFNVVFNNESISDTGLEYHWDFGDGGTSASAFPEHEYSAPGVY